MGGGIEVKMMSQPIRAVYSEGQLRLLDPVDLSEGQEIQLTILSDEDRVRAALSDLLVEIADPSDEDIDEDALAREIEAGFQGQPPLSDTIIEERREGP
jgi:predicted DNA-binding antitoxin AbrB/MazE fold protein